VSQLCIELTRLAPDGLWVSPPDSLHVTCRSLISPRDAYDKVRYWKKIESEAELCMRRLEADVAAFSLHFNVLKLTDHAAILVADDHPSVTMARSIFATNISTPPVLAEPPNTIHTTLCRYKDPSKLANDLPRLLSQLQPTIAAEIGTAVLVRELIYPSLQNEIVTSATLSHR
jgi:hypothetical protein